MYVLVDELYTMNCEESFEIRDSILTLAPNDCPVFAFTKNGFVLVPTPHFFADVSRVVDHIAVVNLFDSS